MSFQRLVTLRLSEWISYFLAAVPPRSRRSFLELLCGCLISPDGWVTRALSHISLRCHWTTYYKLLERESLRTQVLAIAQVRWLPSTIAFQNFCRIPTCLELALFLHQPTSCDIFPMN